MSKNVKRLILGLAVLSILFFVSIIVYVPYLFYSSFSSFGSGFKTQEIIYRHKIKSETIESQWEDLGAFGYSKRIVRVVEGVFSNETEVIDTSKIDKSKWDRVDEYVNELGIKGG